MHFYKLLQPQSHLKLACRLKLNVPDTVIVESDGGDKNNVMMLTTDRDGYVIRKPLEMEQLGLVFCPAHLDPSTIVAVRKIPSWKTCGANTTVALTKMQFPESLTQSGPNFAIQRYIKCKGKNASIHRIVWKVNRSRSYSYNLMNRDESSYCASSDDPSQLIVSKMLKTLAIETGLRYAENIVHYVEARFPSLRFKQLVVDFIKDRDGKWWFLQTKSFEIENSKPPLRFKLRKSSVIDIYQVPVGFKKTSRNDVINRPTERCTLCHLPFKEARTRENAAFVKKFELDVYHINERMILETIEAFKLRGKHIKSWDHSSQTSRGRICCVCYCIYLREKKLQEVSEQLHVFLRREETQMNFNHLPVIIDGPDIDPNCHQLKFLFFFHELQDLPRDTSPDGYKLEYQLGQCCTTVSFSGNKLHTSHRWQICEVRGHYFFATLLELPSYLKHKQIELKLLENEKIVGRTSLSLSPVLGRANLNDGKWTNASKDAYLAIKTQRLGGLTLKVTTMLILDTITMAEIQNLVKEMKFVQENKIIWPPARFYKTELLLPHDWIDSVIESEFVSRSPLKQRHLNRKEIDAKEATEQLKAHPIHATIQNAIHTVFIRLANKNPVPVTTLGMILRSLSNTFSTPAAFTLTKSLTLDEISRDLQMENAMTAFFGQLLLILQDNGLISNELTLIELTDVIQQYWVSNKVEKVGSNSKVPVAVRVMWNRACRRFECIDRTNYRLSQRRLWLCEFFEGLESHDSGLIDIAELRGLVRPPYDDPPERLYPILGASNLDKVNTRLEQHRKRTLAYAKKTFAQSLVFQEAFDAFDLTANGDINFAEFCTLAEKSFIGKPSDRIQGFCLRHGITDVFLTDRVCIQCCEQFVQVIDEFEHSPVSQLQSENPPEEIDLSSLLLELKASEVAISDMERSYSRSRRSSVVTNQEKRKKKPTKRQQSKSIGRLSQKELRTVKSSAKLVRKELKTSKKLLATLTKSDREREKIQSEIRHVRAQMAEVLRLQLHS